MLELRQCFSLISAGRTPVVAVLVGVALVVGACEKKAPALEPVTTISADAPDAKPSVRELSPGVWRYTVRGRIDRLPKAKGVARDLAIHHEAMATFYSHKGENVTMKEMVMDFPAVAADVSLQGLAEGDAVVFDFDVDWSSKDVYVVTRLKRLPNDTGLNLTTAPSEVPDGTTAVAPK